MSHKLVEVVLRTSVDTLDGTEEVADVIATFVAEDLPVVGDELFFRGHKVHSWVIVKKVQREFALTLPPDMGEFNWDCQVYRVFVEKPWNGEI